MALLVSGALLVATSVAATLWNDLGPGPLDVFISAISERTGLPLAIALWVTVGSMILVATVLGRRPGPGTFFGPLLIGPLLQSVLGVLEMFDPPGSIVVRVAIHLVAIVGIGIGLGALIVSGLGSGSGELFAGATSDRVHQPQSRVRPLIEFTWLAAGTALGGPAGLGTVLVAVFIAPSVANGHRIVDAAAARSFRGLQNTHDAILTREIHAVRRENELIDA